MEEYINSTKQKIVQLEHEISKSNATDNEKRDMQHTLSKINIFSGDVFDDAKRYKNNCLKLKEDVIRFSEWTSFEGWILKEMDLWWSNKIHPNLGTKTTKELYEIFLKN